MAQKVQVLLVDDIDGGTAEETVTFALDGVSYEIDLTAENAAQLRDSFSRWVGHARKAGSGSRGSGSRGVSQRSISAAGTSPSKAPPGCHAAMPMLARLREKIVLS